MSRRTSWQALCAALLICAVALPLGAAAGNTRVFTVAVVKAAYNSKLKKTILVDGHGRTLYLYTADVRGKPSCRNDATYHCSKAWPPLTTTGAPHAGPGVRAAVLGTVHHPDGGMQVTYNHHPLYTLAGSPTLGIPADRKPGDVNGEGFIQAWWVVSPSGRPIRH